MIPRYQRILFWVLGGTIIAMALVLLHGCEQAREKLTRHRDETPLAAPVAAASVTVQLAIANDADGTITLQDREIALPEEPSARAHALLARLIAEYSSKNSTHPIESGPAIDDVFLLNLPIHPPIAAVSSTGAQTVELADDPAQPHISGGQLAVINLRGTFADHHPSGVEVELLTINSIIGTLYTNFPRIEQVRFLVDGRSRETLSGHADLERTYSATNTAAKPGQETP